MTGQIYDYPALAARHLDAPRLFADRLELISALRFASPPAVVEVGVAHGEFSEFLLGALRPARFVALDFFNLHEQEFVWSYRTSELLEGKTHEQFYRDRLARFAAAVELKIGDVAQTLAQLDDDSFDLVYVDAGHLYEDVSRDVRQAAPKLRAAGVMVVNDYIMADHHYGTPYGVVRAVNELVAEGAWKVVGFALQQQMFCDIALCRQAAPWAPAQSATGSGKTV